MTDAKSSQRVSRERLYVGGLLACSQPDGLDGRTRIQWLVFLLQNEIGEMPSVFRFERGPEGPVSRELNERVDEFVEEGFLEEREEWTEEGVVHYVYAATDATRDYVADVPESHRHVLVEAARLVNHYGDASLHDIQEKLLADHLRWMKNVRWPR